MNMMSCPATGKRRRIYTIGHSTRPVGEFVAILKEFRVRQVADVRTLPGSRRYPRFNKEALGRGLALAGIGYAHFPLLGGLRKTSYRSINTGWRNLSFRGYADYMQTQEFARGLAALMRAARRRTTAVMCAEAVPWRCHRSLIGDALLARGFQVCDITGRGPARPHRLTPFARVSGTRVTYPGPP